MEITKGIIADIIAFIKSLAEAIEVILGSVTKTPNYENKDYYPEHY